MRRSGRIGIGLVIAATMLAAYVFWHNYIPTVLWTGTPETIQASGIAAARAEIAAGRPSVWLAGTRSVEPIGIPLEMRPMIRDLPEVLLPSGCTHPLAEKAIVYARAHNEEIAHYLKEHDGHRPIQVKGVEGESRLFAAT